MRYRCLLIDHDDTTVDSTPAVHYLAHREQMRRLGREAETLSLEQWYRINYDPGLRHYLEHDLALSKAEQQLCYRVWREFTTGTIPPFFTGVLPLLERFRNAGGMIVVVSHSEPDIILSHYREQDELPGFEPDEIIGWTGEQTKNKPHPWPVEYVEGRWEIPREAMLVVDDLKPGIVMARTAGVDSAGVGWSHRVPELKSDLGRLATYYVESVAELEEIILSPPSREHPAQPVSTTS